MMFVSGIQSFIKKIHFLENPIVQVDYKPFQFKKTSISPPKKIQHLLLF